MVAASPNTAAGPLAFAQFAYPPNSLGLCGPADSRELHERIAAGREDGGDGPLAEDEVRGLRALARGFEGAWPYLQLIALANGVPDPLDRRVVEAYWIGSPLLDRVPPALLGGSLDERFRRRAGRQWVALAESLQRGARPHHAFHVFCVYPWVGLLRYGATGEPLRVLENCRIRWGEVVAVAGERAVVRHRPLAWDGHSLSLTAPTVQEFAWRRDGAALAARPEPGDCVAMHWDWICRPLQPAQQRRLAWETQTHLAIANAALTAGQVGSGLALMT